QAILLVPISRPATTTARRGDTGFILGVRPKRSTVMRRLPAPLLDPRVLRSLPHKGGGSRLCMRQGSCLASVFLFLIRLLGCLERRVAHRRGGIGLPYRDAI